VPPTPPLSFSGLLPRLGGPRGFLDLGARLFELSGQLDSLHVRGRTLRLHLRELHLEVPQRSQVIRMNHEGKA
jgi:hypothetical protein